MRLTQPLLLQPSRQRLELKSRRAALELFFVEVPLALPPARQREVGETCRQMYGTSFLHEGDRLFLRADQLLLATEAVAAFRLPVEDYALGMPFAKKLDGVRIRITHELATLRGLEATKNVLTISEHDVEALLDGKDIACPADLRGDALLRFKDLIIGTSLAQHGILKNRLPRWIVQRA